MPKIDSQGRVIPPVPSEEDLDESLPESWRVDYLDERMPSGGSIRLRGSIYLIAGLVMMGVGVVALSRAGRPTVGVVVLVTIVGLGGVLKGLLELITGRGWKSLSQGIRIAYIVFVLLGLPLLALLSLRLFIVLGGRW